MDAKYALSSSFSTVIFEFCMPAFLIVSSVTFVYVISAWFKYKTAAPVATNCDYDCFIVDCTDSYAIWSVLLWS